MSEPLGAKWSAHWASYALQAATMIFVIYTLARNWNVVEDQGLLNVEKLPAFLGAVLLLVVVVFFVILAYWHSLSSSVEDEVPTLKTVVRIYGRTILAKYIPGNVFHYLGRQVVGRELGLSQVSLAAATMLEVLLLISATSLVTGLSINFSQAPLPSSASLETELSILALGVLLPLLAIAFIRSISRSLFARFGLPNRLELDHWQVFKAFSFYLIYVAGNNLVLIYLHIAFVGAIPVQLGLAYFAAFSISFLAGYLTPGVPGGLGVREALFALLLSSSSAGSVAAFVAVVHRLAVLGTEMLYAYAIAPRLSRSKPKPVGAMDS